ncbi:MAG: NAD-dependent epimerase/dehydratase family protein, partial [Bacteroidales bacterium]
KRKASDIWRCANFHNKVRWVDSDTDDFEGVVMDFAPDAVINSAWGGVLSSERGDWSEQIKNIDFQQQLLDISLKSGVKRFIAIGSQAEYGIINEYARECDKANPVTAYGAVKLAASDILRSFCIVNGIEWYWFRLFSVFGEREGELWLIPSIIKRFMNGEDIDATEGEQRYAYLYVGEAAEIVKAALITDEPSGVYNISSDKSITIRELINSVRDLVNPSTKINFGAIHYRDGQSMFVAGDMSKTDKIYKPDTSGFEIMLKRVVDYYK